MLCPDVETLCETLNSSNMLGLLNAAHMLFQDSFDGVLITTPDIDNPSILFVNAKMCEMSGYRQDELLGKSPALLQGEKTKQSTVERLRSSLSKGTPFHGTAVNYRKDGEEYHVEWKVNPIKDTSGNVLFFLSVHRDVGFIKTFIANVIGTSPSLKQAFKGILAQNSVRKTVGEAEKHDVEFNDHDEIELFDDFNFDANTSSASDVRETENTNDATTAADYLKKTDLDYNDILALSCIIEECVANIELAKLNIKRRACLQDCLSQLHEFANIVFMMDEFSSISTALYKLVDTLLRHQHFLEKAITLEIMSSLIYDLNTWISDVFVNQTAEDIHQFDASIIGSVEQMSVIMN